MTFRRRMILAAVFAATVAAAFLAGWVSRGYARTVLDGLAKREVERMGLRRPAVPAGYAAIPCPAQAFTIAVFGQSNAINGVAPLQRRRFPDGLVQYDWKSDQCYRFREPLLGTDGEGGNAASYLAEALHRARGEPILVIPFGAGGTSVGSWGTGPLALLHRMVMQRLTARRIAPDVFLWHQGEADAHLTQDEWVYRRLLAAPYFSTARWDQMRFTEEFYRSNLELVIARTYRSFPETRFGVALVSRCDGDRRGGNPDLVRTQRAVAAADSRSFVSVDSDAIDAVGDRSDGCHFSNQGARKLAAGYFRSIAALR